MLTRLRLSRVSGPSVPCEESLGTRKHMLVYINVYTLIGGYVKCFTISLL